MSEAHTETRNGWGPAAPANGSYEEQDAGPREEIDAEEIGGEHSAAENGSSRRVYTGERQGERHDDERHDDERQNEDEHARGGQSNEDTDSGSWSAAGWGAAGSEQAEAEAVHPAEPGDSEGGVPEDEPEQADDPEEGEIEEFGHPPSAQPTVSEQPEHYAGEQHQEKIAARPEPEAHQKTSKPVEPEQAGASSNGKNESRDSGQRRQQPSGGASREQAPQEQAPQERASREQASREQASREQAYEELASEAKAFDPDARSRVPHGTPQSTPQPRPAARQKQASYGAYGAGKFRRAIGGSLGRLPAIGKLFGSGSSTNPDARSTNGGKHQGIPDQGMADQGVADQGMADQGIAAKPSPQEIERRLALALRETYIDGFSKIAVGSPKGGVGKSSLAYGMGCAIANNTNIRVCLVDADPEFGATRSLVPRPVPYSIVDLARDADHIHRLSDIRSYVAQNERMRLDVLLNPQEMIQKTQVADLPAAYERIDDCLSRFYDLVIYDMGIGFSHPQIQTVLGLSDELLLVGDSEVVPNEIGRAHV